MPHSFTRKLTARPSNFELRIEVYRDAGYLPPEDADRLTALCGAEQIHMPEQILRNVVLAYR